MKLAVERPADVPRAISWSGPANYDLDGYRAADLEAANADSRFSTLDRDAEAVSRGNLRLELTRG